MFNREVLAGLVSLLLVASIFHGTYSLLSEMAGHDGFSSELAATLVHFCLFGFLFLLLFSSCIAALNYFFSSKDISLLLTAPILPRDFFSSRIVLIAVNSGWMFVLFGVPSLLGLSYALELPLSFVLFAFFVLIPYVLIPVFISSIAVIALICIVPAHRLRDVLILMAFFGVGVLLYFSPGEQAYISTEQAKVQDLIVYLEGVHVPDPSWSPSSLAARVLFHAMNNDIYGALVGCLVLYAGAIVLFLFSLFVFRRMYLRAWSRTIEGGPVLRVYDSRLQSLLGCLFFPWNPQLRALAGKEWRLFVRDTTQSLQLLLLLMLTFVYLFNFRALRQGTQFSESTYHWWHVVLSLANISFGSCVIAAIATRFVYPSISLEGRAYTLLRNAPLSFEQLLRLKYYIWLVPITFLTTLLLVSGTWAIQAPIATIVATVILSISLSISIVGLGVGVGAVYARFDWETPAQVTASFGSLVFMLLALGTIFLTSIPALFIFILTCVPTFRIELAQQQYLLALALSYFTVFCINWGIAKRALSAGAHRLRDMER